jgi:hypothetical protein
MAVASKPVAYQLLRRSVKLSEAKAAPDDETLGLLEIWLSS